MDGTPEVDRLRSLARLSRGLCSSLGADDVLREITRTVAELIGAERVALWGADEASRTLTRRASSDPEADADRSVRRIHYGEGIVGEVAETRRPCHRPDLSAVPIVHQDLLLGVLLMDGGRPLTFSGEDSDVLDVCVAQAAVILRNTELASTSEARGREAQALAEVGRLCSETREVDAIALGIAEWVRRLFEAALCALFRLEPASGEFRAIAVAGDAPPAFVRGLLIPPGLGALGLAERERRSVSTTNVMDDPRIQMTPELRSVFGDNAYQAALTVPLVVKNRMLGALVVKQRTGWRPDEGRVRLAEAFADQAALALASAEILEDAERRRRAAESLAEVERLVTQSLDLGEVTTRIVECLCALVNGRVAGLYRLLPDTGGLRAIAVSDSEAGEPPIIPGGTGTIGLAVSERRTMSTPDVLGDERILLTPEVRRWIERSGYRAVLALPLVVGDQVIGALSVGAEAGRVFSSEEIALAERFGRQASLALANAEAYGEATRRRWEAEILGDVGSLFAQSLDAGEVGQRIVDSLRALLGARAALLCRLDLESGDLLGRSVSGAGLEPDVVFPAGTGAMGRAVRERALVATPDVLTDSRIELPPALRAHIGEAGYRSVLAVPLLVKGVVIGALSVGDVAGRVFTADESRLVHTFADHAALAWENARLFEDTERRRHEARVFAELSRQINASLELDTVLELVALRARELADADGAALMLREPGSQTASFRHRAGTRFTGQERLRVEPGRGAGGRVLLTGCPFRTADYGDEAQITDDYREFVRANGLVALMVVPIQGDERVEGLLYVDRRRPRPFTDRDEALLVDLAEHAAIAIKNGQLLHALRSRQARLEALLDVSHELSKIQPVRSLLDAIARACGHVLGTESVGFRLVEGDDLVIGAVWGDAADVMVTAKLKIGQSLSGIVAATGEPLLVMDAARDPRVVPAHRESLRRLGYRAWLGVPVKTGDRVVGTLTILTRHEAGFSKEDVAIATAFASQAATALENARLFQELEQAYTAASQAKAELTQSQKMEAIGRLAGGMAHDFNNLLTIVHGRCEILRKRIAPDDRSQRDLEIVRETTRRAAALISQLLAFSRKQMLQPKIVSVSALVQDVAALFRRLLGEDIELTLITTAEPDRATADPIQLEQVLMNLAVNARDAMPQGGKLTITTASVDLDEAFVRQHPGARRGPHVALSVSDSGSGMTPEVLARVFEPFFTTKGPGKGTGLGLSTVYGIVKQHEGYVQAVSEPGHGTTFTIYLPSRTEGVDEVSTLERTEPTIPRGSETILLVEDEDEVRELAREILEMNGYTVLEASHGAEALHVCREHTAPIELLLTDVVMPGMSGRELARHLVALRPHIKVLYMSGYSDDALGNHGVLDPDILLLAKPFTPESLLGALRRALDAPPP